MLLSPGQDPEESNGQATRLNTKVLYAPLTGTRLRNFLGEYGGTDHSHDG